MEINSSEEQICCSNWRVMSPEIVEIGEDSKTNITSIDEGAVDVYVAVGKNDLDVVKWVLDHHAFLPDTRIFLVHVFSPISYIPTPVGRLSSSQLSKEQVQTYINEEHNRRKNLLLKYISLCSNAKVVVDTMIVESNAVAKAILDLIPVVNITNLVMGSKRPPATRLLKRGVGKAEYVRKSAPEYCEVTVVCDGKKVVNGKKQHGAGPVPLALASLHCKSKTCQQAERNFFECFLCFPGKFN